jgi:hypothetical protein
MPARLRNPIDARLPASPDTSVPPPELPPRPEAEQPGDLRLPEHSFLHSTLDQLTSQIDQKGLHAPASLGLQGPVQGPLGDPQTSSQLADGPVAERIPLEEGLEPPREISDFRSEPESAPIGPQDPGVEPCGQPPAQILRGEVGVDSVQASVGRRDREHEDFAGVGSAA